MALVTPDEVRAILDTSLEDTPLSAFITAADLVVTKHLTSGYSAAELKEIERWLSAHLAVAREKQLSSQKIGDAADTYLGRVGLGLDASYYGQQVKVLEHQGILMRLEKQKASLVWMGTEVSNELA